MHFTSIKFSKYYRLYNDITKHCYQLHHNGKTWKDALDACNGSLMYFMDGEEMTFLNTTILLPQAERSVFWLAGQKLMHGRPRSCLEVGVLNHSNKITLKYKLKIK